jgi:uncharacterized surface protein with fasciclin (FAS1) repeats
MFSTDSELPGSTLNKEMNRGSRKTIADVSYRKLIKCRFYRPTVFAVGFEIHGGTKTKHTGQIMKITQSLTIAVIAASAAFTGFLHAEEKKNDIVAVASGAGDFNTLVAAVKAAGLVETLQGPGPFTVFAPTDAAFAKLPKGTVEDLLKPENKAKLASILTYHVVAGKVMAADVKTMKAKTVNGQSLDIKVTDGTVTVDDAKVVKTDVAASNGVIHVIDSVVLPK